MVNGGLPTTDILDRAKEQCSAKNRRPQTDVVTAGPPNIVSFDIDIKYYVTAETEAAASRNVEGEGGAVDRYIAWQISEIGRDINPDDLHRSIMPEWPRESNGVVRVEITAPFFVAVDDVSVAQWSGVKNITHEVTEA